MVGTGVRNTWMKEEEGDNIWAGWSQAHTVQLITEEGVTGAIPSQIRHSPDISHHFFTHIPRRIHLSCTLWNPIDSVQMHALMHISVHLCTHSRDQHSPSPSHFKDKASRSLTYTVTEYPSHSEESLFASPRMFLSQNIKGLLSFLKYTIIFPLP